MVSRCSGFWPGCRLYDPTLLDLSTLDAPPTNHRSIASWCCCLVAQVKHSESVSSRSRPRSEISNQSIWGARGGEQTRRIPKRGGVVIAQVSLRVQVYMTLSYRHITISRYSVISLITTPPGTGGGVVIRLCRCKDTVTPKASRRRRRQKWRRRRKIFGAPLRNAQNFVSLPWVVTTPHPADAVTTDRNDN